LMGFWIHCWYNSLDCHVFLNVSSLMFSVLPLQAVCVVYWIALMDKAGGPLMAT
jgi:hypothetical protein